MRTFLDYVKLRGNKEKRLKHKLNIASRCFPSSIKRKINKDNKINKNILRGYARQSSAEQLMFDLSDETFDEKG